MKYLKTIIKADVTHAREKCLLSCWLTFQDDMYAYCRDTLCVDLISQYDLLHYVQSRSKMNNSNRDSILLFVAYLHYYAGLSTFEIGFLLNQQDRVDRIATACKGHFPQYVEMLTKGDIA